MADTTNCKACKKDLLTKNFPAHILTRTHAKNASILERKEAKAAPPVNEDDGGHQEEKHGSPDPAPTSRRGKPLSMDPAAIRKRESRARARLRLGDAAYKEGRAANARARNKEIRAKLQAVNIGMDLPPILASRVRKAILRLEEISQKPVASANDVALVEKATALADEAMVEAGSYHSCESLIDEVYQLGVENVADGRQKKAPSRNTVEAYVKQTHLLYRQIYKKELFDCRDFSWLRDDYSKVIKFVLNKYNGLNSQVAALNKVTSLVRRMADYRDVYAKLTALNKRLANQRDEERKAGKITDRERDQLVHWTTILAAPHLDKLTPSQLAIYRLYTEIPPRRLDYRLLKVKKVRDMKKINRAVDKLPADSNYVILNKNNIAARLVFKRYKTDHAYGTQVFTLPASLRSSLSSFIADKGVVDGGYVFGKEYTGPQFSKVISTVFEKAVGKHMTVNNLRHSFISYKSEGRLSAREIDTLAKQLGHSATMFLEYNRIDLNAPGAEEELEKLE